MPFLANFGQIAKIILLRYKNYIACMLFIYLCTNPAILLLPLVVIVSENSRNFQSPKRHFSDMIPGTKKAQKKSCRISWKLKLVRLKVVVENSTRKIKFRYFHQKSQKSMSKNGSKKLDFDQKLPNLIEESQKSES